MIRFLSELILAIILSVSVSYNLYEYDLDKSKKRTSSLIKGGNMNLFLSDPYESEQGYGRNIEIKLAMKTIFGAFSGEEKMFLDNSFFTEDFWVDFREVKDFHFEKYSLRYLGRVDEDCENIEFYNIKIKNKHIKDVKIKALICKSIEGLGAKKLDFKGVSRGYRFKAGFDLK